MTAVIFTDLTARVLPMAPESLGAYKNVVLDADLSKVEGIPPHFWKLDHLRNIVPMTYDEAKARIEKFENAGSMEYKLVNEYITKEVVKEVEKRVEVPVIEQRVIENVRVEKINNPYIIAGAAGAGLFLGSFLTLLLIQFAK